MHNLSWRLVGSSILSNRLSCDFLILGDEGFPLLDNWLFLPCDRKDVEEEEDEDNSAEHDDNDDDNAVRGVVVRSSLDGCVEIEGAEVVERLDLDILRLVALGQAQGQVMGDGSSVKFVG